MKFPKIESWFYWKGNLAKVVGISDRPTVIVEMFDSKKCPHCGGILGKEQFSIIPDSPLFKENAKPLITLEE